MRKSDEGLNFFYKLLALSLLWRMHKYPSINYPIVLSKIRGVLRKVDANLVRVKENPYCLGIPELEQMGIYKKKYPVYATYLAALSSYPILYKVGDDADIAASMFAKVASILSIKVLDNINDTINDYDKAVQSLVKHEDSLTSVWFTYNTSSDLVEKAENSAHQMARWAYYMLRRYVDDSHPYFASYKNDVRRYVIGQRESFRQKFFSYDEPMNLHEYITKILDKNIGNLWFDIDFCIYERKRGKIDGNHSQLVKHIKRSIEYLHKATLLYDDVSDLPSDLQEKIVNSVVIYGVERGHCSFKHMKQDPGWLIQKLERERVLQDIVYLGDLTFSKGIEHLHKANELSDGAMDIDALIFQLRVLRGFAIRKWVIQKKNFQALMSSLKPFNPLEKLVDSIPTHVLEYEKALV